jgi:hypothetical protein
MNALDIDGDHDYEADRDEHITEYHEYLRHCKHLKHLDHLIQCVAVEIMMFWYAYSKKRHRKHGSARPLSIGNTRK